MDDPFLDLAITRSNSTVEITRESAGLATEKSTLTYYLKRYLSAGILNGSQFEKLTVSILYFMESLKLIGYRITWSDLLDVHHVNYDRVNFEPIGFLNELAVCSRENPSRSTRPVD